MNLRCLAPFHFLRPISQGGLSLLALSFFTVYLSGCRPPTLEEELGQVKSLGRPVHLIAPKANKAPYHTVVVNGQELIQTAGPLGKFGGTLYLGSIGDEPKTFNPWASLDATSSEMGGRLSSGLLTQDAYSGEYIPLLAKSFEILPDQKTYRVVLRQGLQWSDGKPISLKDVLFTWNVVLKQGLGNASMRDILMVDGKFPEVRAVGPHTIEFKTAIPWAPFLSSLTVPIAPAHIFEPIIAKGKTKDDPKGDSAFSAAWGTKQAAEHPETLVSSGMWILEKYYSKEQAIFRRNPKFFMVNAKGQRLPYVERQVVRFMKDMNNQALQFEQGKLDVYNVPGRLIKHVRLLHEPQFDLFDLGPTTGTQFLVLNLNPRKNPKTGEPYVNPIRARWFQDVNFRKAIDYALDRENMVNNILHGVGSPLFTSEALSSIYVNPKLAKGHPRDLDIARAYLKKSGFTWDDQGKLHDRWGNRVEFNLVTNTGNDERESTGVSIIQDLDELGIKVNFQPLDFNILVNKIQGSLDWEGVILGLTGSSLEPHNGANVWKSTGSLHLFNQRQINSPADEALALQSRFPWEVQIDALMERGAKTLGTENRKPIYYQMQQLAYDKLPFIYLYSPRQVVAVKSRIKNLDPTPLGGVFHNLEELWIQENP